MATQLKCHLQTCHLDEDNNTLLSSDVELWILLISLYISLELSATCKLTGCVTEVSDYSQRKYLLRKKKKKKPLLYACPSGGDTARQSDRCDICVPAAFVTPGKKVQQLGPVITQQTPPTGQACAGRIDIITTFEY